MTMENDIQYYHCYHFQYNHHHLIISSIILIPHPKWTHRCAPPIFHFWLLLLLLTGGLSLLWFWFYCSASSCSYFSWLLAFSRKSLISTNIVTFPPRRPLVVCSGRQWVPSFPFFPLKSCQCLFNAVQRAALIRWYIISSPSKTLTTYHGSLLKLLHLGMG